jgi:hypothetical protein
MTHHLVAHHHAQSRLTGDIHRLCGGADLLRGGGGGQGYGEGCV